MAGKPEPPIETQLPQLIINLVESQDVYDKMTSSNQIEDDQFYFVVGENEIDTQLSETSTNAVQNKVITKELNNKQPKGEYLTSANLSGAIDTALGQAKESGQFDGKDGTNATITNATASTDATTENPSVKVTVGGTESARTFDFAFTGLKGKDGKTPQKGTDYWTESDQKTIVDDVLAALPTWNWGAY